MKKISVRKKEKVARKQRMKKEKEFSFIHGPLKQLCGGNWNTDMEEEAKKSYDLSACFIKVTKNDIEEFMMKNKWKPRFHPGLLNNVIDNSMFDNEESKQFAIEQKNIKHTTANKTAETNQANKLKAEKKSKNKGTTANYCFFLEKEEKFDLSVQNNDTDILHTILPIVLSQFI